MMIVAPPKLPGSIDRFIRGYIARAKRVVLFRQLGVAAAFALGWLLVFGFADRLWPLSSFTRWIVLLLGAMLMLLQVVDALLQLFNRRIDYSAAAIAIEHRVPALAQRLETVVSQLSSPKELRASSDMTSRLVAQVEDQIAAHRSDQLLKISEAAGPWIIFATLSILTVSLCFSQWMDMNRIAQRVVWPAGAVAPVSTTRLIVAPGTSKIPAGRALTISVQAEGLGSQESPRIHLTSDNESYLAAAMSPLEGRFVYVIPAADRDFAYYVTAGDARTPVYSIHVMQPPAVKQFDITYTYPAYMKRPALHVSNSDGLIEAPVGTTASFSVLSTEPLSDAHLAGPGQQIVPLLAANPASSNSRQATLAINSNQSYQLEMTSRDGVGASFAGRVTVRALPDHPPLARLIQPDSDLRLHPRDILPLTFQALDDYGITSLVIEPQINARPAPAIPLALSGDPRRQESTYDFDLVSLKLNIGDVLSLSIAALDGSGQRATSEMRHILLSPRSIDLSAHQRLLSLKECASLSRSINDSLTAAAAAMEEANHSSTTRPADRPTIGRALQNLGNAIESSTLLRQELLSALAHASSSAQAGVLANLLDSDVGIEARADLAMSRLNAASRSLDASMSTIKLASPAAIALTAQLSILSQGEQAAALLADHANLSATRSTKPTGSDSAGAQRLAQTVERAQKEFAAGVGELGLKPDALDLTAQLQHRIDEARTVEKGAKPVDFVELARQWTLNLGKPELSDLALPRRLEAGADAESASPEPDLVRANDLNLCSRAARMMEAGLTQEARNSPDSAAQREQFAPALAALEQEHRINTRSADTRPPEVIKSIHAAATEARAKMRRWAAEPDLLLTAAQAVERQRQSMALEANAEMISRNYERAAQLDQRVTSASTSQPAMLAVQRVDQVSDRQRSLAQQTAQATPDQALLLSERQRQVAEAIERAERQNRSDLGQSLPDPGDQNARQHSLTLIQRVQEDLTDLPRKIDIVRRAAESLRSAKDRLALAQTALASAPAETKDAARRSVDQAAKALAYAETQWQSATQSLDLPGSQALANDLLKSGPDTSLASQSIQQLLVPALNALAQAGSKGDSATIDESAESARRAIARIQEQLRTAQADLVERDPLVAAGWFAQAASMALAQKPPDFPAAMRHQAAASAALSRAWIGAVRQAAATRLMLASNPVVSPSLASKWGNLSIPQSNAASSSSPRGGDAPEYEEAIKAYFEALAKAGESPP